MSTTSDDFFYGWDLLYKTIEKSVNKKDDLLIALVHMILTKHSKFSCIGIGDDKTLTEDEEASGSELLPDHWNDDDNNYALRYRYNNQLYVLLGFRTEGSLIITLLDAKTRKVSNIGMDPENLVKHTKGNLKTMIPTASQLADRFRKELLEPVFSGTSKTVTTQTTAASTSSQRDPDSLRIGEPRAPRFGAYSPSAPPSLFGFPVGRGDLDPLGNIGPGNLFPFPSRPNFRNDNQGRFDPFGPPEPDIRPNPNPDHMRPPSFGDDFYM